MRSLSFEERYDVVLVDDHRYLFTNSRIERDSIPEGLVAYDVRDTDECSGEFAQIQPFVLVNHWGTIIGKHKLHIDKFFGYLCDNEDDGLFNGEYFTVDEYIANVKE